MVPGEPDLGSWAATFGSAAVMTGPEDGSTGQFGWADEERYETGADGSYPAMDRFEGAQTGCCGGTNTESPGCCGACSSDLNGLDATPHGFSVALGIDSNASTAAGWVDSRQDNHRSSPPGDWVGSESNGGFGVTCVLEGEGGCFPDSSQTGCFHETFACSGYDKECLRHDFVRDGMPICRCECADKGAIAHSSCDRIVDDPGCSTLSVDGEVVRCSRPSYPCFPHSGRAAACHPYEETIYVLETGEREKVCGCKCGLAWEPPPSGGRDCEAELERCLRGCETVGAMCRSACAGVPSVPRTVINPTTCMTLCTVAQGVCQSGCFYAYASCKLNEAIGWPWF